MVDSNTNICIEGFPRSANSFMVNAFKLWNPGKQIAHHLHVSMQVHNSLQYNIPCIVLVRHPLDAISSLLIVDKSLSLRLAIQSYVSFYSNIEEVKNKVVVAEFSKVISEPGKIIESVNQLYQSNFFADTINDDHRKEIFLALEKVHKQNKQPKHLIAIPTKEKDILKQEVKKDILSHPIYAKAVELYKSFQSVSI